MKATLCLIVGLVIGSSTWASITAQQMEVITYKIKWARNVQVKSFTFDPDKLSLATETAQFAAEFALLAPTCRHQVSVGGFLAIRLARHLGNNTLVENFQTLDTNNGLLHIIANFVGLASSCPVNRYKIYASNGQGLIVDVYSK